MNVWYIEIKPLFGRDSRWPNNPRSRLLNFKTAVAAGMIFEKTRTPPETSLRSFVQGPSTVWMRGICSGIWMNFVSALIAASLRGNCSIAYSRHGRGRGEQMKKKKFFKKLFMAYILIVVVYTFIAAGVFYYKNNEIVNIELTNSRKVFLDQVADKIDNRMRVVDGLINQLRLNTNILDYAASEDTNIYFITRVYNNLNHYIYPFSDFGYKIDLTKKQESLVITPRYTLEKEKYYKEMDFSSSHIQNINDFLTKDYSRREYIVIPSHKTEWGADPMFTIIAKEKLANFSEIVLFISFYEKDIMPETFPTDNEAFLITDSDQAVSFRSGSSFPKVVQPRLLDLQTIQSIYSEYTVQSRQSAAALGEWRYYYISPNMIISSNWKELIVDSLFAYLLLALAGIILSFFVTNKMYKPIRNMVSVFTSYGGSEPQDDLAFIQETTFRISKANKVLRETVQNNRMLLKNKFLRDLVYGIVSFEQIAPSIEQYELDCMNGQLTVIIIEFANYKDLENQYSKEVVVSFKEQAIIIIEEQIKKESKFEILELEYNRYLVIANENDIGILKKQMSIALSGIEPSINLRIFAAIGQPVQSVYEIEVSFRTALQLLERPLATEQKAVVTLEDFGEAAHVNYYYPLDVEKELIAVIMRSKEEEFGHILEQILVENLTNRNLNRDTLSPFIIHLLSTIYRILQRLGKTENELFLKPLYFELMDWENIDQFKRRVTTIFSMLFAKVQSDNNQMDNTITSQMLNYIHENYNKDFSLTDIAEHLNFTPGYISTLFKNYTGDNFKDYLNKYRVEKAKEILKQGNVKINELAGIVGCNNSNTFIRIFKKYEGISPGQYIREFE